MPLASINKINLANIASINHVNITKAASFNHVQIITSVADSISISSTYCEWDFEMTICVGTNSTQVTSSSNWTAAKTSDPYNSFSWGPSSGSSGDWVDINPWGYNFDSWTYSCEITFTCGTANAYFYGTEYATGIYC